MISSGQDIIDSRDINARITELEDIDATERDEEDTQELAALTALRDEVNHCEWDDGLTLISDSHFEDYARELAEDVCGIRDLDAWPASCIDWDAAAEALQQDYSQVDFDGETFWYRS